MRPTRVQKPRVAGGAGKRPTCLCPSGKLQRTANPFPLREKTKWAGASGEDSDCSLTDGSGRMDHSGAANDRTSDGDPEVTTGAGDVAAAVIEVQSNGPALPGKAPPGRASRLEPGGVPLRTCISTLYASVTNHSEREPSARCKNGFRAEPGRS